MVEVVAVSALPSELGRVASQRIASRRYAGKTVVPSLAMAVDADWFAHRH